jgi:hypothetical protein
VKEDLNMRINTLRIFLREGNRLVLDLNKNINRKRKLFREEKRSTIELQALQKVQEQFDSLIEEMMRAKMLLTGFEMGGNDAYYEEHEETTNKTW